MICWRLQDSSCGVVLCVGYGGGVQSTRPGAANRVLALTVESRKSEGNVAEQVPTMNVEECVTGNFWQWKSVCLMEQRRTGITSPDVSLA
jgi:hypothetical protein